MIPAMVINPKIVDFFSMYNKKEVLWKSFWQCKRLLFF